jgi:L-ascorbate metabolism protein UlaG (beta-lactamase superfamily)
VTKKKLFSVPPWPGLLLLAGLLAGILLFSHFSSASESRQKAREVAADAYMKNENLPTIRPDWPGNPMKDGRFTNVGPDPHRSMLKVLKWKLSRNPQQEEKEQDTWLPVVRQQQALFSGTGDQIVWLGHASFALRLGGLSFLIDPVFFDVPFTPRQVGLPLPPENITGIDYVLLSHGHMDHTDKKSLQLLARHNDFTLLAPLRLPGLVQKWVPNLKYQEAGWYQRFDLPGDSVKVFLLPAYHWYKRTPFDDDKRLWGSFILQTTSKTIFISGDTGYENHFQEIAGLFPTIDVAIMGVGAYKPAYVMETSHLNPVEAVHAFHHLGGKVFIPMHYGTYDLSDEPLGEPYRLLRQQEQEGKIKGQLKVLDIGEAFLMNGLMDE